MNVKVNVREDGLYDVVVFGMCKRDVVALRNAHSDVVVNRRYAQAVDDAIINALRDNDVITELHEEWKDSDGKRRFDEDGDTEFPIETPKDTPKPAQFDLFASWV